MTEESPTTLTREEARKRIGLGKRDRVADYLPKWLAVEERLTTLVINTEDLIDRAGYEKDLHLLREVIQVLRNTPTRPRRSYGMWIWAILVGGIIGVGYLGYQKWVMPENDQNVPIISLEDQKGKFARLLEKRRWNEIKDIVTSLTLQGASEEWLENAKLKIEQGQAEEQGQQVGFLIGNAQAALESRRLTDARKFCNQVEKLQPDHPKLTELHSLIDEGLLQVKSMLIIKSAQKSIDSGNWELAEKNITELVKVHPDHAEIPRLRNRLEEIHTALKRARKKADELLAQVRLLDQGTFSTEALSLLEEAIRIAPNDELRTLYKKMSEYGRALKVPTEFKTIAEALKVVRPNDLILIAKGTYQESLTLPANIKIFGESRESTILECEGAKGSVITLNKPGSKVRIASLTLRHRGLGNESDRFPVVAVSGARLQLEDVLVSAASGHGIAIVNGGNAEIAQCEVRKSGWDGIVVQGENSTITLNKVISRDNLHNGLDFWGGGRGTIEGCQFLKNGRSGVYAIEPSGPVIITESRSEHNRQIGLYFLSAPSLSIGNCEVHENLLGGILIGDSTKEANLIGNKVTKNGEVGVAIERGVKVARFEGNIVEKNKGKQVWKDAIFPEQTETEVISIPPPPPAIQE
ncbi:right-handed parallel beta-helix repeat-containing protein [Akkermansiaceae bacterium]|nr:right-handed parallel beta-helix repeat-containing protein [Akkermansiaceae bacterium]